MCGRYYIEQEEDIAEMRQILDEINKRFYGDEKLGRLRTGEIFPTNVVPVLKKESPDSEKIVPDLMFWGFPHFRGSGVIINARAETAAEKRLFRPAVRNGRILIPANAFFEWGNVDLPAAQGGKKAKYKLSWRQEATFYMAGLCRSFPDPKVPGRNIDSFVILTTGANSSVAALHDRMPLILPRSGLRIWLNEAEKSDEILRQQPEMILDLTKSA